MHGVFQSISSQAEREEHQQMIDEKQSRALLKNTLDPLLSQLTKVRAGGGGGRFGVGAIAAYLRCFAAADICAVTNQTRDCA
jgi:hypothetical protein